MHGGGEIQTIGWLFEKAASEMTGLLSAGKKNEAYSPVFIH
jgi:hypothetical protein|tara:strand:+ start:6491 stop:6613 length:123 start_codon:yes stop_codon:yes gene_type:complete